MTVYTVAAAIFVCLCCSAFFSAAEMTYSSCNTLRLENLAEEGNARAKMANYITEHFDNALSTILIGNNLANIAGSSLVSVFLIILLGTINGEKYAWAGTVVMTVLVIIFGETLPKILAKKNANRYSLRFSLIVRILMVILYPVVWIVVTLIRIITLPIRGKGAGDSTEEKVEELQNIIETAEDEKVLDEERSELIQSAIDFSDISAYEVMTARVDVCALNIDDGWENILKTVESSPFSRLPVYSGSKDSIIGILSLNHFLRAMADSGKVDIRSLLMPPIYIYKTMKLPDVLTKLRKSRQHLAVVSDEYGGMLGVISLEDVLEQIVGDIWDDTDTVEQEVIKRSEDEFEVDGDMAISDFLELIGIRCSDFEAESETVGGWTVESIGDFPKVGDSFVYGRHSITVLSVVGHRVERVLVKRNPEN